jgi:hypothetical protein
MGEFLENISKEFQVQCKNIDDFNKDLLTNIDKTNKDVLNTLGKTNQEILDNLLKLFNAQPAAPTKSLTVPKSYNPYSD